MKIPLSWLNEYVDVKDIPIQDLRFRLDMAGLEVEGIEAIGYPEAELPWDPDKILTAEVLAQVPLSPTAEVDAAVEIAFNLGMSEAVVGLTIIAFSTSLPELATTVVALLALWFVTVAYNVRLRKESDAARAAAALDAATLDDPTLRHPGLGNAASVVAQIPEVRRTNSPQRHRAHRENFIFSKTLQNDIAGVIFLKLIKKNSQRLP